MLTHIVTILGEKKYETEHFTFINQKIKLLENSLYKEYAIGDLGEKGEGSSALFMKITDKTIKSQT